MDELNTLSAGFDASKIGVEFSVALSPVEVRSPSLLHRPTVVRTGPKGGVMKPDSEADATRDAWLTVASPSNTVRLRGGWVESRKTTISSHAA